MNDPSAGIDDSKQSIIIIEALQSNIKKVGDYETLSYIAGGSIAGILGLTNIKGLFFFLLVSLVVALGIAIRVGFKIHDYTNTTLLNIWIQGMSNQALSFVLFWTLTYALVYIY